MKPNSTNSTMRTEQLQAAAFVQPASLSTRTSAVLRNGVFSVFVALFLLAGTSHVNAQDGTSYQNAIGLGIDFGDGQTMVGVSGKHFFTENHVGVAEILFGDNFTAIQAFYQYHREIEGAAGLRWYAGAGLGVGLYKNGSSFLIRPVAGLDYKINGAPLSFSFDWRPWIWLDDNSNFEPARFGLGFRYAFSGN